MKKLFHFKKYILKIFLKYINILDLKIVYYFIISNINFKKNLKKLINKKIIYFY